MKYFNSLEDLKIDADDLTSFEFFGSNTTISFEMSQALLRYLLIVVFPSTSRITLISSPVFSSNCRLLSWKFLGFRLVCFIFVLIIFLSFIFLLILPNQIVLGFRCLRLSHTIFLNHIVSSIWIVQLRMMTAFFLVLPSLKHLLHFTNLYSKGRFFFCLL